MYILFISLCSDVKELLENFVDREHNCDGNTENGLSKSLSSFLHFPQEVHMNELETILEIDNDTNVEIAQACAKELDDVSTSYLYTFPFFSFQYLTNFNQGRIPQGSKILVMFALWEKFC